MLLTPELREGIPAVSSKRHPGQPPGTTPPDGSAPAPTQTPADGSGVHAPEASGSTAPEGRTALTDPTNVRMVVVCPRCEAQQASPLLDACTSCGADLRVAS